MNLQETDGAGGIRVVYTQGVPCFQVADTVIVLVTSLFFSASSCHLVLRFVICAYSLGLARSAPTFSFNLPFVLLTFLCTFLICNFINLEFYNHFFSFDCFEYICCLFLLVFDLFFCLFVCLVFFVSFDKDSV